MPGHSSYRKNRASMEQLLFFVNYAHNNPRILTSRFGTVSDLWEALAQQLNSMDGACRTAEKWKENMFTWRCQLRCRARRGRSSGVPEFDEFAMCNMGQQRQEELTEQEDTDEDDSQASKKLKEPCGNESEREVIIEPEVKIEIKTEIEEENTTNITQECSVKTEQHPEAEVTLDFEEDIYIKTDIEFDDHGNGNNLEDTSTELVDLPTLGFPKSSRSETYATPRSTTTANTTTKFTACSNSGKQQSNSCASKRHEATNVSKDTTRKRKFDLLACPKDTNKISDTVLSLPSRFMNKPIALDTTKVQITGSSRKTTPLDSFIEADSYSTEDSLQSASLSPISRVPEDSSNAPGKRKATCLSEMYETLLTSMKKRDEREEQILSVLQGLTVAVTRLADNLKRLEEVLTCGTSN